MSSIETIARERNTATLRHSCEPAAGIDWLHMHRDAPAGYRPCFSRPLLHDLREAQRLIAARSLQVAEHEGVRHLVLASDTDVFNLGGDLELFCELIRGGDRDALLEYARLCCEVAYGFASLGEGRIHTIAVVQGDALGGGFEAALCCHTIIAEHGAGMGFPEVLFNLFPGMGAYSFLSRRVSSAQAERMMLDGRVYGAEELQRLGVVDLLVPRGEGSSAARELVRRRQRIGNAQRAMNRVRDICHPVTLSELYAVTDVWVDAAMRLNDRALQTMERLVRAQKRRGTPNDSTRRAAG
jgi:DSF synthase